MSDAANYQNALDPERPWITDERQLPANMNWLSTLFNPAGKSPKLHFTRAWTLLFMLQLACVFGITFAIGIVALTGADTAGATLFNLYLTAIVFIVTTIMSFVIHCRRLNDAGKWSIWAFVVLIPLLAAATQFYFQVQDKVAAYDELYAERTVYLADPEAWEERNLVERRKAQVEARAEEEAARQAAEEAGEDAENNSDRGQNRGGQRGGGGWDEGPTADKELPSQEEFILRPTVGVFQQTIMPLSAMIMLWTLLWVARVPNFGGRT